MPAGGEFTAALAAAATSYLRQPGDDQQAASAIASRVGWSLERARWFLSVNLDLVRQTAARLAAERPANT